MNEVKMDGLSDLYKLMQELPGKVEGNIMRGALRAGQTVIKNAIQAKTPQKSGALRNSVRIRFRPKSQKKGYVRMQVVVGDKKAWYSHLIEYGTASFYTGQGKTIGKPYIIRAKDSKGNELGVGLKRRALKIGATMVDQVTHPGIRPQPFVRPAFDESQAAALNAVVQYIKTRIPKEFKKAGK
jgi:HK97 gp10 family phage protein